PAVGRRPGGGAGRLRRLRPLPVRGRRDEGRAGAGLQGALRKPRRPRAVPAVSASGAGGAGGGRGVKASFEDLARVWSDVYFSWHSEEVDEFGFDRKFTERIRPLFEF